MRVCGMDSVLPLLRKAERAIATLDRLIAELENTQGKDGV